MSDSPLVTIAVWRRVEDDPPDGQPGLVLLKRRSGGRAVIASRLWASVQATADEYESWAQLPVPPAPGGLTLAHLYALSYPWRSVHSGDEVAEARNRLRAALAAAEKEGT